MTAPAPAARAPDLGIEAIVFDLDGVLVDTVEAHAAAWRRIAEMLEVRLSEEDLAGFRGVSRQVCMGRIAARAEPLSEIRRQALADLKNRLYRENVRAMGRAVCIPGVDRLLDELAAMGFALAVASTSHNAPLLLEQAALGDRFEVVSDGYFPGPHKPDPAQLLHVARAFGRDPRGCLLLEDAPVGLEAGAAAGMRLLGVGPVVCRLEGLDGHLDSLRGLTADALLASMGASRAYLAGRANDRLAPLGRQAR